MATNRAKRREQRLQSALLDRLTFKYQRLITKEIAKTMVSVNLSDPMGVDQAEAAHEERLTKLFTRMWNESGDAMVNHLFGEQRKTVFTQFGPTIGTNAIMRDYLRIFGNEKVTQVGRTTINQLKDIISQGVSEGLSERDLGKAIREKAAIVSASRAQTIARTETHAAANYAAQEAFLSTGIEAKREWVAATDERTRLDHIEANGQIVGLNEAFSIGDDQLMYPGDPSGSPEQVINCRCSFVFVFDEEQQDQTSEPLELEPQNPAQRFDSGAGEEFNQLWNGSPEVTQMAMAIKEKPTNIKVHSKNAYYLPSTQAIVTTKNARVFTHEYSHFIDFKANEKLNGIKSKPYSFNRGLHTALYEDAKEIGLRGNVQKRNDLIREFRERWYIKTEIESQYAPGIKVPKYQKKSEEVASLSDIYDAATKGIWFDSGGGAGHGKKYYKFDENVATETFAQMSTIHKKPEWEEARQKFPRAVAVFESMMEEIKEMK